MMSKIKKGLLILILIIAVASLGCMGKKQTEPVPTAQPTVTKTEATPQPTVTTTPVTGISDADLTAMETDLNNLGSTLNDSGIADGLEMNVTI